MSRYASQIDGDFVPVTGPCGERVYAKISRVERDDLVKKFDTKVYSNGRVMLITLIFFILVAVENVVVEVITYLIYKLFR